MVNGRHIGKSLAERQHVQDEKRGEALLEHSSGKEADHCERSPRKDQLLRVPATLHKHRSNRKYECVDNSDSGQNVGSLCHVLKLIVRGDVRFDVPSDVDGASEEHEYETTDNCAVCFHIVALILVFVLPRDRAHHESVTILRREDAFFLHLFK